MEEPPPDLEGCNVRKCLAVLRQRWESHGPTSPICLSEMVDDKLTLSEFCCLFLMAQRTRRNLNSELRSEALQ